jgi:HemK-like putative methylase
MNQKKQWEVSYLRRHGLLNQLNLSKLIKRKIPLAYIIGSQFFLGRFLKLRFPVLIPRPETEYWMGNLIKQLPSSAALKILDLGTGTGCIAAALGHHMPSSSILAVDLHPQALRLARHNCRHLPNVHVVQGDIMGQLADGPYDLIVSNPPYVPIGSSLPIGVRTWEAKEALFGGIFGTDFHKRILEIAPRLLKSSDLEYNLIMETDSRSLHLRHLKSLVGDVVHKFEKDQFGKFRTLHCLI